MQTQAINKKTVYYALQSETMTPITDADGNETGDYTISYGAPVPIRISVSAAAGSADTEPFGVGTLYDRTMITSDMNCPIKETTRLWVERTPNALGTIPHDYIVTKVAKSVNCIRYAIQKVETK